MNSYSIHKALDAFLENTAAALFLPVAWENTAFTPPADGAYLEADFLPAENEDFTIQGSVTLKRGIYQVTVVTPIGSGSQKAEKLASQIVDAFGNNVRIPATAPMYVNGEPSVFSGIVDDTGYRTAISIAYTVTA